MEGNREQMRDIFDRARRLPKSERAAFLDGLAAVDGCTRAQIEDMLAALDEAGPFLSEPTHGDRDVSPTADPAAVATMTATLREGPGTRIGSYKLLQLIGEGGFGTVFMAEQERPVARKVALKIIKLGMDTRQVIARFEAERQALAMMDHPNIARVLDAGATETGRPYFVMELVKGDPIVEYCDRNNLNIQDRLELFAQVCNAVQHAHSKGIIHRDIKPSNILVSTQDAKPHTKVIDFGIAKATQSKLTEKTLFTEHKALIGTPEYMSPEQAEGALDIDTRTDVYSLGVLLYELLTGTTPFSRQELRSAAYAEIQRIIREVEPPKPSTRLSSNTDTIASVAARRRTEPKRLGAIVRGDLDWIVMKALEKDRQRRYETANGLAMDIWRYLSGEAVLAAPPSTAYRFKKFIRRNRVMVTAGGAVATALLIGVVAFAWQAKAARAARAAAEVNSMAARSSEAKAVTERYRAQEISRFLREIIESPDPSKDGAQVTLVDVLRHADNMLPGRFTEQPGVELELRETIGKALVRLHAFRDAEPHLLRALELASEVDPPSGDEDRALEDFEWLARWVEPLFKTYIAMGEPGRFTKALAEVLERVELKHGKLDPRATVLRNGAKAMEPALRFSLKSPPDVPPKQSDAKSRAEGRIDRQRARVLQLRELHGELDLRTIDAMFELAAMLKGEGGAAEAASLFEAASAAEAKVREPADPARLRNAIIRAKAEADTMAPTQSIEHLRRAIATARASAGGETAEVIAALQAIAEYQHQLHDDPGCLLTLREALDIAEKRLGLAHQTTVLLSIQIMPALAATGRTDEQERLLLRTIRALEENSGPSSPFIGVVKSSYGSLLAASRRHEEAVRVLRSAIEAMTANPLLLEIQTHDARLRLAESLIELSRWDEAQRELEWFVREGQDSARILRSSQKVAVRLLIRLNERRNSAEPGMGYDAKAAEWKAKLEALNTAAAEVAAEKK